MENIAHSLVGITLGEAAYCYYTKSCLPSPKSRLLLVLTSLISNNICDIDFFYYPLLTPGKMGYLIHHRGHTHTLLGGIIQSALLLPLVFFAARKMGLPFGRELRVWISVLAFVGPLVHIAMDGLNSYGIHPFWPFDNRWIYGDTLFVVEPFIWALILPALLLISKDNWVKAGYGMLLFVGNAVCWLSGFVPLTVAAIYSLICLTLLALLMDFERITRLLIGLGSTLFLVALFFTFARKARTDFSSYFLGLISDTRPVDIILSPYPANPLCWTVITVEVDGEMYRLRRGVYATVPSWISAEQCPRLARPKGTAGLKDFAYLATKKVHWIGGYEIHLQSLIDKARANCRFASYLRFARAPFLLFKPNAFVSGDLRFDRDEALGFAELYISEKDMACPASIPLWEFPLKKIIQQ